jgi:hypothetical protein
MTFTGDEFFYLVWVPSMVVLFVAFVIAECFHGNPK